ncbi:MAG: head GIN domain-containing protein [Saprospiraceae bacterium]
MKLALPIGMTLAFVMGLIVSTHAQKVQNIDVKDFDKIRISSSYTVVLKQGNRPGVVISGSEKELEDVIIENNGSTLILRRSNSWKFRNWFNTEGVTATVTYTHLESIKASGASSVRAEHILEGEHFSLEVSGASDLDVEVDVGDLTCSSSGASDIKLFGQAGNVRINCSGASEVKAKSFRARSADIDCSGASTVHLGVDEMLDANASGASDIYIYGSPRVRQSRSSGASDIHFRDKDTR